MKKIKDSRGYVRINKDDKLLLKMLGESCQSIIDNYLKEVYKVLLKKKDSK